MKDSNLISLPQITNDLSTPGFSTVPEIPENIDNACWKTIGVYGNRTCNILSSVVHCQNCDVFANAGRLLFRRQPPPGILEERTAQAAIPADEIGESHQAGLLFRLGTEWFLLEAANTVEVTEPRLIRRIPRRTNSLFLGMVNIRGELKLAFDLRELLGITPSTREPIENQRLIVSRMEGQTWVFPAPEVKGILHYLPSMQTGVPTTIERWKSSFISSIVTWEQKKVGVLDSGGILGRLGKYLR